MRLRRVAPLDLLADEAVAGVRVAEDVLVLRRRSGGATGCCCPGFFFLRFFFLFLRFLLGSATAAIP